MYLEKFKILKIKEKKILKIMNKNCYTFLLQFKPSLLILMNIREKDTFQKFKIRKISIKNIKEKNVSIQNISLSVFDGTEKKDIFKEI